MKTVRMLMATLILVILVNGCSGLPNKQTTQLDDFHIAYARQGNGGPAVIFEAGFASEMDAWKQVFKPVAEVTTVFAYDRKGMGNSRSEGNKAMATEVAEGILDVVLPGAGTAFGLVSAVGEEEQPVSRDAAVIVEELHRLLIQLKISPPYVLVGHSLGGMYMEMYARTYPLETAGLVLVDPRRADFTVKCKENLQADSCELPAWLLQLLPSPSVAEYRGAEMSAPLMAGAGSLPNVPMVVLTAYNGNPSFSPEQKALWLSDHQDLVREVPQMKHIVLQESGHFIQRDRPQVVINAILSVVQKARLSSQEIVPGS